MKYSKAFWTANVVEFFERAAYYAVFIAITLYLTQVVGFNDIYSAWIGGVFSAGLYLLPPFTGAFADKIGFRKSIILAFSLLTLGYFALGALPYKPTVIPALLIIMIGGSFIKSIITGTIAKTTTTELRSKGYSIFYAVVNIGAFLGKTFAFPLRLFWGIESINFFSAAMTLIALILVYFFYKNIDISTGIKFKQVVQNFTKILSNTRLLALILIITGFWIIQGQLYATMPKYVIRTVGVGASPEWIANVNPAVVMLTVVLITNLMKKRKAINSMTVGMFIMPVSALCMASSPILEKFVGKEISMFWISNISPITIMLIVGIIFQGLAECFISPRYLEYFSLQAPKGQEGMYLGFGHLYSFFSNLLGFGLSGYLLTKYCPDPKTLAPEQLPTAYDGAYIIWIYFAAIGLTSGIALLIYSYAVKRLDKIKLQPNS
jgi:dipeptide/tripeptide permease